MQLHIISIFSIRNWCPNLKNNSNQQFSNMCYQNYYQNWSTIKTGKMDTPVGYHFNLPDHSISDMSVLGIESLGRCSFAVCLSREKMWMKRLWTI